MTSKPDFSDQTGIFNPRDFGYNLTIIGCGGIGASALPTLATLGIPRIVLWDPDEVEERNVASQLMYRPQDVGRPKVEVAAEILRDYGAEEVITHKEFFTPDDGPSLDGVVISAVDSMKVRKEIWETIEWNGLVPLFLDGRIGGELCSLLVVRPSEPVDLDWYRDFELFDDDEVDPLPCTERAIVYPAVLLGALMASAITMFHRGLPIPRKFDGNLQNWGFDKLQPATIDR